MGWIDAANTALRRVPAWPIYAAGFAQVGWLFWRGATGGLGVEPIEALEHRYGLTALQLLIVGLAISPLRRFVGLNLIRFRRATGLMAFYFLTAHLLVWLALDLQSPAAAWQDVLKRPYVTVGMAGFALLLPLALTSNDGSVRWLGPAWRRLHRLTYPAVLLGALHFVILSKGWQVEPMLYLATVAGLILLRWVPRARLAAAGGR